MCNHSKDDRISDALISKLKSFLKDEAYDTDGIIEDCYVDMVDVLGTVQSNIVNYIENDDFLESITKFIGNNDLSTGSFSIGLIFYYWPYYKDYIEQKRERVQIGNVNDHGGHSIKDLYVSRKHDSLKEDMLECGYLTKDEYHTFILSKAQKYIQSDFAKQTQAAGGKWMKHLHYQIEEGTLLSIDNLMCVIAYCDFSDLCTDFTSTFRSIKPFEALSAIKERNRKYWWLAKILRETVQYFGDNKAGRNFGDEWINVTGPFYCGMGVVMAIPEFNIRLCSPTSTSKQFTVAARFGGDSGMIIEINNNGDAVSGTYLRCFNCTWLSKYCEEDERLFFGGDYRIRIMSVRNIETKQNFARFARPLFFFDAMIDGSDPLGLKDHIEQKDIFILSSLINIELGSIGSNKFDKYVEDSFHLFCLKKSQIIINLDYMHGYFKKSKLSALVMNSVERDDIESKNIEVGNPYRNLFRSNIFSIFQNLRQIVIYSTSNVFGSYHSYSFSFSALLALKDTLPTDITITIKATWDTQHSEQSWISKSFDSQTKTEFNTKGLTAKLKITKNARGEKEDCLVINSGYDPVNIVQTPRFPRISSYDRSRPSSLFNAVNNLSQRNENYGNLRDSFMIGFSPPPIENNNNNNFNPCMGMVMSNQMSLNPWQQQGAMSYYPPPPLPRHQQGALSMYSVGGYSMHQPLQPQHHTVGSYYSYHPIQSITTPPLHPVQAQIQPPNVSINQMINEYPPPPLPQENQLIPPSNTLHNASIDWINQMELLPKPTWQESDDSLSLTASGYNGSSSEFDEEEDLNDDDDDDDDDVSVISKNINMLNENSFVHSYIQENKDSLEEDDDNKNPWISDQERIVINSTIHNELYWTIGEEQKFPIIEWVKKHYHAHSHKKGIFGSKNSNNLAHLLSYVDFSKLKSPLNKECYEDEKLQKQCMQCWKNMNSYMGLRKTRKTSDGHIDKIIRSGIKGNDILRNEIYCQIMKQMTNNPKKIKSLLKGWKLLLICCSFFPPSKQFVSYLSCWIWSNTQKTGGIGDHATNTLHALDLTMINGERKCPPLSLEILKLERLQPVPIPIYFVNGMKCCEILVTSQTTKKYVMKELSKIYDFKCIECFSLYEMECNISEYKIQQLYKKREKMSQTEKINDLINMPFQRELDDNDRILDTISSWNKRKTSENDKHQKRKSLFNFVPKSVKIVLKVKIFRISMENNVSKIESKMIFLQHVWHVTNGFYPININDELFAINLAALQLQGTYEIKFYEENVISNKLHKYLPQTILNKYLSLNKSKECEEQILKIGANKYNDMSRYECWLRYGKILRNNNELYLKNYFGSLWFRGVVIKNKYDLLGGDRITNDLLIGINENGISFVNPLSQNIIERYDMKELINYSIKNNIFLFVAGTMDAKTKIPIASIHSKQMKELINSHVQFKISKLQNNNETDSADTIESPSVDQSFKIQDQIKINRQKSHIEWNGQIGIIIGSFNKEKQRYPVQIQIENKPTVFLKPSDMILHLASPSNQKNEQKIRNSLQVNAQNNDDGRTSFVFQV